MTIFSSEGVSVLCDILCVPVNSAATFWHAKSVQLHLSVATFWRIVILPLHLGWKFYSNIVAVACPPVSLADITMQHFYKQRYALQLQIILARQGRATTIHSSFKKYDNQPHHR